MKLVEIPTYNTVYGEWNSTSKLKSKYMSMGSRRQAIVSRIRSSKKHEN